MATKLSTKIFEGSYLPTYFFDDPKMKDFTKVIGGIWKTIITQSGQEGPPNEKILRDLKKYLRLFIRNVNR